MLNKSNIENVLEKYNLYFRALSLQGKQRFINRTADLSSQISIIGKDIAVSDEMRVILYAYFVQMTFGYQQYTPGNYSVIHLFKNEFQTSDKRRELEGKTYADKIIALSWYHFSKSHLITNDGENLGYFHIGQALVQSLLNGKSSDDVFCSYFDLCAKQVFEELSSKRLHNLYLQHQNEIINQDFQSLFPYLMELFFEKPLEFQTELPNSYAHLCVLMNQDPLGIENDFKLNKEKFQNKKGINPLPLKIIKIFSYYQNHWLINIPLINIILLPVLYLYYVRPHILLSNLQIVAIYALLSVIIFVGLKHFFVGRKLIKTQLWFAIFTLAGLAPTLIFFTFLIGIITPIKTETTTHQIVETYTVIGQKYRRGRISRGHSYIKYIEVYFDDKFLYDNKEAREFYIENQFAAVKKGNYASYEIGRSIFGFMVVKDKFIFELPIDLNQIK